MKKNFLDKKFRHSAWFKEGRTVKYVLDYCVTCCDIWLSNKPSSKQSGYLFDNIWYDNILTDGRYTYRLTQEEYDYYVSNGGK